MQAIIQPRQLMSQPMGLAAIDPSVLPAGSIVWTPGNGGIMVGQITNIVTPAGMASRSNASSRIDFGRRPRLVAGAASWLFTITTLNSSPSKLSGTVDTGINYLEHIGVNQNESEESAQGYLMFGTRPTGAPSVGNFSVPAALVVGQQNTFCVVLESESTVRVYRDGLEMTLVRSYGNPMNTAPGVADYSLALLNRNVRGAFSQGGNVACALFARIPAKVDGAKLSANPWQIFKPIPRRLFVPVSSGGANTWNLDPTSASHGQTSGAGALVLSYLLSAASASHAQSATQAEITTGKTFDPVATNHAQSATSPAITFNVAYAPSGASHAQSVTQSAIALAYTLSPSGALHAQSATVSEISSGNVFDPVSSSHAHSAASPAISLNITATPASASHAHSAGPSALNLRYVLSVNGADHAQIAGQCSLTIGGAGTGATAEEIAAAVWAHVTRTLTASAGPSAESIAAATVSALMATMIPVDVQKMNSAEVIGDGSEAEPWRGLGVSV